MTSRAIRSPSCSHSTSAAARSARSGQSPRRSRRRTVARATLRPDCSKSSSTPASPDVWRSAMAARQSARAAIPAPVHRPFTGASRAGHRWRRGAGDPPAHGGGTAAGGHDPHRRARDPPRAGARARRRRRAEPVGPRVRPARRARAQRRAHRAPRGPVPTRVGRDAARRRPLDRRLRPQAPREARARAAGPPVHPHPRRLRLPVRAGPGGHPPPRSRRGVPVRSKNLLAVSCCAALALAAAACGSNDTNPSSGGSSSSPGSGGAAKAGGAINGAGATFPAPVYQEWAARFKETSGTTVNYQAIGSGGGIAQFSAGTVDFGASDAPMKDDEIATAQKKGSDPVHVPTVLGAVTVSYNVDGVDQGLKLDGKTVADIFLGKVEKWNDPAIAGQNSGTQLPSTNITVCHRSDESGTTANFTSFLTDYSSTWKSGPGTD